MNVVIHSIELPFRELRSRMRNFRRQVEGPFRSWIGDDDQDRQWRFYQAPEGTEAFYAATRLAAARGAEFIMGLGAGRAAASWFRDTGTRSPALVLTETAYDLRCLRDVQQFASDTAEKLPIPLPPELPGRPFRSTDAPPGGKPIGSLALPLTVPLLAEELYTRYDIGMFDNSAAGMMEGALQAEVPALFALWVRGEVAPACESRRWQMPERQALARTITELFSSSALSSASSFTSVEQPKRINI